MKIKRDTKQIGREYCRKSGSQQVSIKLRQVKLHGNNRTPKKEKITP